MHIMTTRGWAPLQRVCCNHNTVDVFVEVSQERVAALMEARSERYLAVLREYMATGMTRVEFTNLPIHKEDLTNLR